METARKAPRITTEPAQPEISQASSMFASHLQYFIGFRYAPIAIIRVVISLVQLLSSEAVV
jgi:hypothetical protein